MNVVYTKKDWIIELVEPDSLVHMGKFFHRFIIEAVTQTSKLYIQSNQD